MVVNLLPLVLGLTAVTVGAFFDVVSAIGILKLPNFFTRVHSVTIGAIGGSVLPLIGVALISIALEDLGPQRFYLVGTSIVGAIFILILAPTGAHSLARAAYTMCQAPRKPLIYDALENMKEGASCR
ncbi:MAG: monovalent cation/H(+) antiporter subunit G [Ignisphaera sp.]|nr:monovalent cation/H(+) antiporter subunit G [Ignisphaera sp.]MCX8167637.1 monovalent cation/H(+) antiporter subunit G [Ignisphaera sp.]MDW8085952.1 monovalent cation/H(+) antiporter subunit G [Ignisphaera sp.]